VNLAATILAKRYFKF